MKQFEDLLRNTSKYNFKYKSDWLFYPGSVHFYKRHNFLPIQIKNKNILIKNVVEKQYLNIIFIIKYSS